MQTGLTTLIRTTSLGQNLSVVQNLYTILLLSAYSKSVAGSIKTFTPINKSPLSVVQQFMSSTELFGFYMLRSMEESIIFIYEINCCLISSCHLFYQKFDVFEKI